MKERDKQMILLRLNNWTLQKIADRFSLTHQRVNQILTAGGYGKHRIPLKLYDMRCKICGKIKRVNKSYSLKRKFCSIKCLTHNNPIGKPQKEWLKEDWIKYNRIRNFKPENIERRKQYYEKRALDKTSKS